MKKNFKENIQVVLDYIEQLGCLNSYFMKELYEEFRLKNNETERKILYSPGFGAGWSTWCSHQKIKKFMIEYPPLIEFLENGGKIKNEYDKIIQQFEQDCQEKFGQVPCLLGAHKLKVAKVCGPVKINEYDGSESLEEYGDGEFL